MADIETINNIFCEVFNDEEITVNAETTADDIEGWDSLTHMVLIESIEAKFGIEFSSEELVEFKRVGDILESLQGKLCSA